MFSAPSFATRLILPLVLAVGFAVVPTAGPAHAAAPIAYHGAGPNAATIGLIGDSSFAGVRWLKSYEPLKRYNFVLDAESCRRTLAASCRGREGYAPSTGLNALRSHHGRFDDVLVMVTGYNDPGYSFGDAVDRVMAEAIRQGIDHVVWLTMRTAAVSYVSPGFRSNASTFRDNNRILLQKAGVYNGRLHIADWAGHSTPPRGWVTADGIHLTRAGTVAVTTFIANQVAAVLAGRRITPGPSASGTCRVGITLRPGDDLNDVRCLELHLRSRGLFRGVPDKRYDAVTAAAVNRVNAMQGWGRDGIADAGVLQTIGAWRPQTSRPFCTIPRTLRLGSKGNDVSCLIRRMASYGYHLNNQLNFSQSVHEAVVHYRRSRGLSAGGVADPAVLSRLGVFRPVCRISTPLRPGDSSTSVNCLRQFLRGFGLVTATNTLAYDGVVTDHVRTLERWRGLPVDGVADEWFLRYIAAWKATSPVPGASVTAATAPTTTIPEVVAATTTAVPATDAPTTSTLPPAPPPASSPATTTTTPRPTTTPMPTSTPPTTSPETSPSTPPSSPPSTSPSTLPAVPTSTVA